MTPQFFDPGYELRSYTRSFEREIFLRLGDVEYTVWLNAEIKLWESNYNMPSVSRIWPIRAFDGASHQIMDKATLTRLQAATGAWAEAHLDELVEEINGKGGQ